MIADKGYDSGQFRQSIVERSMTPVIPPRSNRKEPHEYDAHLYRERHPVECFINRIKQFRRIFSRFEKLDAQIPGLPQLRGRSHLAPVKCQHTLITGIPNVCWC